jgi:hypothetical protein
LLTAGTAVAARIARDRIVSIGGPDSDEIDLAAVLQPIALDSRARAFRGGRVLAWFGGVDVDLRGATLDPTGARLTFRAIFGGGRVIVPAEWRVSIQVISVFGGAVDARSAEERGGDSPLLVIDGLAVFGGVAVVSEKPEETKAAPSSPAASSVEAGPSESDTGASNEAQA